MDGPRLAIVGSTDLLAPGGWDRADWLIRQAIVRLRPDVVISGGAPGIDSLAEYIAGQFGYTEAAGSMVVHRPQHQRWRPDGFEARNLLIARDCTHLLRISCYRSRTYGSGWTADQAERAGAEVVRRVIGPIE